MTVAIICRLSIPKSPISSLGNELSGYFYYTHTKNAEEYLVLWSNRRTAYIEDSELDSFYHKLKWQHQEPLIDYKSDYYHTYSQVDLSGKTKANYLEYWQAIRPSVRAVYTKNIKPKVVEYPVVHFRCSDAPFVRCLGYNLTKASTVNWMAEQIKNRGYNKIIFLNCNKHKTLDRNKSCTEYTKFYSEIFEQHGISIEYHCGTIYQDFALMVYSPLLVSLNTSSYSFMAGISKDPKDYISNNIGLDIDGKYYAQTEGDWLFDKRAPLMHSEVKDYFDTDDVIKRLKN